MHGCFVQDICWPASRAVYGNVSKGGYMPIPLSDVRKTKQNRVIACATHGKTAHIAKKLRQASVAAYIGHIMSLLTYVIVQ